MMFVVMPGLTRHRVVGEHRIGDIVHNEENAIRPSAPAHVYFFTSNTRPNEAPLFRPAGRQRGGGRVSGGRTGRK